MSRAESTQILQHLQSQATEKMENLTTSMQKDSHTVRVIAFLTFIYLPATFVSVSLRASSSNMYRINILSRHFSALMSSNTKIRIVMATTAL